MDKTKILNSVLNIGGTSVWNNIVDINKINAEIIVQPSDTIRFRYKSEKTAGRIFGKNHSTENPIFPTVKIYNYTGDAYIRVSSITKDGNRPHPHSLVKMKKDSKTEECYNGIFSVKVPSNTSTVVFSNLGFQCVKKDEVMNVLETRRKLGIDPFNTGFDHQISASDLHCLRLCFEIFIGNRNNPLKYITLVSDSISDAKALLIYKMSHVSGSVKGDEQILMFCEKIVKSDDIKIRFFEEKNSKIVWSSYAKFQTADVHKQVGIAFFTPQYKDQDILDPVEVNIQLVRQSDGTFSQPHKFIYKPLETIRRQPYNNQYNNLSRSPMNPSYNIGNLFLDLTNSYVSSGPSNQYNPSTNQINKLNISNIYPSPDEGSLMQVDSSQDQNYEEISFESTKPNQNNQNFNILSNESQDLIQLNPSNQAQQQIKHFEQVLSAKQNFSVNYPQFNIPSNEPQDLFQDCSDKLNLYDSDKLMQLAEDAADVVDVKIKNATKGLNSFS